MNLLYDHQIFSAQQYGGISRYFYELIPRLLNKNNISLHMGFYVNEYGLEKYKQSYKKYFGLKRPIIPKTGRIFSAINVINLELFAKRLVGIDIYHATYYKLMLQNFKGKRVVTVYDLIHDRFPEYFPLNDNTIQLRKRLVELCEGVICISESTKYDLISTYNISEEKVKVIYLANSINSEVSNIRIVDEPYILYVGSRGGYKNFKMLLLAYSKSRIINNNYKLVCFGGGVFSQAELEIINNNQLELKVIYISGADDKLANLYNHADVYVMPSLYEGFGLPPLEAMHHGCPVIASNRSSIPEVVGDAGLYFNPDSFEDLSEKLELVLHDNSLREALISKGYEQEKKFSWDKCAAETLSFYKQIAAGAL